MIPVIWSLPQMLFGLSILALIAGMTPLGRFKMSCCLGVASIAISVAEWL